MKITRGRPPDSCQRRAEPAYSQASLFRVEKPQKAECILGHPEIPPETDAAVLAWMKGHGWNVAPPRWAMEPESGFHVWEEDTPHLGRSHALWVAEAMIRHLSAEQLVDVLNGERVAEEIQISFKVRIEERGAEYRVSIVPRRSGEFRRQE